MVMDEKTPPYCAPGRGMMIGRTLVQGEHGNRSGGIFISIPPQEHTPKGPLPKPAAVQAHNGQNTSLVHEGPTKANSHANMRIVSQSSYPNRWQVYSIYPSRGRNTEKPLPKLSGTSLYKTGGTRHTTIEWTPYPK